MPVILFLFQPIWTELTYWGMASVQNIGVLSLSAIILYMISNKGSSWQRLIVVFILTCATMLTGANGILLLIPVTFILLIRCQYQQVVVWLIAGCTFVKLYWIGFLVEYTSAGKVLFSSSLLDKGLSFAGLMGAFVESQRFDFLPVVTGIAFFGLFTYLVFQKLQDIIHSPNQLVNRYELFILAYSFFLLLTMGAISVNRHYDAVLHVGRYKIYSVLLLICLYLLSLGYLEWNNRMIQGLIVLSLVFNGIAYKRSLSAISIHQAYLNNQLKNWLLYKEIEAPNSFMKNYYEQRWTKTYIDGFYIPPILYSLY